MLKLHIFLHRWNGYCWCIFSNCRHNCVNCWGSWLVTSELSLRSWWGVMPGVIRVFRRQSQDNNGWPVLWSTIVNIVSTDWFGKNGFNLIQWHSIRTMISMSQTENEIILCPDQPDSKYEIEIYMINWSGSRDPDLYESQLLSEWWESTLTVSHSAVS